MVEQVNNLLLNLLISGRGVFLPSVGSLYTRFGGARLPVSYTHLTLPTKA